MIRILFFLLFFSLSVKAQNTETPTREALLAGLASMESQLRPIEGIWAIDLTLWSKNKLVYKCLYDEVAIVRSPQYHRSKKDTIIGTETFSIPLDFRDSFLIYSVSRNTEARLLPVRGCVSGAANPSEYWLHLDREAIPISKFEMPTVFEFNVKVEVDAPTVKKLVKTGTKTVAHRFWYKFQRNTNDNAILKFTRLYPKLDKYHYDFPAPEAGATCFAIDEERKLLITNEHVVADFDDSQLFLIWGVNGDLEKGLTARVLRRDITRDLALLEIIDERFSSFGSKIPYVLVPELKLPGVEVFTYGFSGSVPDDGYPTLSHGYIASNRSSAESESAYKLVMPLNPGHSGSPVFDIAGNVVAVAHSIDFLLNGISYGAKSTELIDFLKEAGVELQKKPLNELQRLPLDEKAEVLKPFIYRITAARR